MPWFEVVTKRVYRIPANDAGEAEEIFQQLDGKQREAFQVKGDGKLEVRQA